MTVTFLRVEGVSPLTPARLAGQLALQSRSLADKAWRTAAVWSSVPFGGLIDDDDATRWAWVALRGWSEDRLQLLADEVVAPFADRVRTPLAPLIRQRRRQGDRVVLVTDLPARFADPLLGSLGADAVWSNRLSVQAGRLTGALVAPLVSSRLGGQALRDWAAAEGCALECCTAYASRASDAPLLSAVGHPCAVDPDRALARMADRFGWPVAVQP
jgi:phosphoserine phosphatase